MNILIITPGFPTFQNDNSQSFGAEFLLAEAHAYAASGAHVKIITPHSSGLPKREWIGDNIEVIRFRYFFPDSWQKVRKASPLYDKKDLFVRLLQAPFFLTFFIFAIIKGMIKADIVHANWTPSALLALPFQRLLKTPVVLTYRGSDLRILPSWLNRFITKNVCAVLDVWGDTGWAIKQRHHFPANYIKLPLISRNSALPNKKKTIQKDKHPHIALITRLVSSGEEDILKGTTAIIPAISTLVQNRLKDFKVDIIGDGPDRDRLSQQKTELKMDDYVTMHGFQIDVFPYIERSSAVITSTGLSAVIQEAGLSKRTLIIPDHKSHNGTLWQHQKNALLYKPGDAKSLAGAMKLVIEQPELCAKIALEGYKTVRKYVARSDEAGSVYLKAFSELIRQYK